MAEERAASVRPSGDATPAVSSAQISSAGPAATTRSVPAPERAGGWAGLDEHTRNRVLFAVFVAFLLLYPLIDRGLGFGRMGSMNPTLIFTLLEIGRASCRDRV